MSCVEPLAHLSDRLKEEATCATGWVDDLVSLLNVQGHDRWADDSLRREELALTRFHGMRAKYLKCLRDDLSVHEQ